MEEATSENCVCLTRLWDRSSMTEVKTLVFDMSVSSMEYVADGEILVITYGKTIAFYNALRYAAVFCFLFFFGNPYQNSFHQFPSPTVVVSELSA